MTILIPWLLLLLAAVLEAGGDALVRVGLHGQGTVLRACLLASGAVVLFVYGITVNAPSWDFGKLLGVYVVLFFVVAQLINLIFFGIRPGAGIWVGGSFIVSGGLIITMWRE